MFARPAPFSVAGLRPLCAAHKRTYRAPGSVAGLAEEIAGGLLRQRLAVLAAQSNRPARLAIHLG
jgi:hypothetical protein